MPGTLPREMFFPEASASLASLAGAMLDRGLSGPYQRETKPAAAPAPKPFPDHECGLVEWMEEGGMYGPEETGWAMCIGSADYGAAGVYCNVRFCPLCGKELPTNSGGMPEQSDL